MNKLKVGLLIDQNSVPSWVYKMIQQILDCDYAEITLIIKNKSLPLKQSFFVKLIHSYKFLLYSLYVRFDKKTFKINPNAFELTDINSLIQNIETLDVLPHSTKLSDRFSEADLLKINSYNLDVIVRLGFKILRGNILKAAKYGIWSFHHGDNKMNRGGPAGVWEVLQSWDGTGVTLQILTEELDGGIIIERSYSKTDYISIIRNNNNAYWKSIPMIPRNLKKLHTLGGDNFMSQIDSQNNEPYFYYNKLFVSPTNFELGKLIVKKITKKIKETFYDLFFINQWILMYSLGTSEKISQSFFRFKKIFPPKDRFWADPFVVFKDELYFVFFEELLYKRNKGHISVLIIDSKGKVTAPVKVLEKNYHLSYPFIFEHNKDYYMIPESEENKSIDLYKCTEFPYKWEFINTLMDNVSAVDTTIHFYNNKYWMFCNIKESEGASTLDELFIFYADDFNTKNWYPHAKNPVISDVKKARPAGKIFKYKGEYYRPSQDCSKHYGRGMHIGKIVSLTENEYIEESIQFMYSLWDKRLKSTHTLNSDGNLTIIDGQIRRCRY